MEKECSDTNFKEQGRCDVSCSNCRGIKLMSHAIKLWERVIEARLKEELVISDSSTVNALNVFV